MVIIINTKNPFTITLLCILLLVSNSTVNASNTDKEVAITLHTIQIFDEHEAGDDTGEIFITIQMNNHFSLNLFA